jgi:hypothetical protein
MLFSAASWAENNIVGYEVDSILLKTNGKAYINRIVYYRCSDCLPEFLSADETTRYFVESSKQPVDSARAIFYTGNGGTVMFNKVTGKALEVFLGETENVNE